MARWLCPCLLLLLLAPAAVHAGDPKAREAFREGVEVYNLGFETVAAAEQAGSAEERLRLSGESMKQFTRAAGHFRASLALDGRFADASLYLGRCLWQTGQEQDALNAWRKAINLDPTGPVGREASGEIDSRRRDILKWTLGEADALVRSRQYKLALARYTECQEYVEDDDQQLQLYQRYWACAGAFVAHACQEKVPDGVVAVAPFRTLSGSETAAGREFVERILASLTAQGRTVQAPEFVLKVLGKGGAAAIDEGPDRLKEIGRELGASLLVTGFAGQTLRARAIDLKTGSVLGAYTIFPMSLHGGAQTALTHLVLTTYIHAESREPNGRVNVRDLGPGAVLKSGDQLQIVFSVSREAFAYVIWFDSSGRAWRVFPETQRLFGELERLGLPPENPIPSDLEIVIPHKDLYIPLDDHTGTETIVVIASLAPLEDLEGMLREIEASGGGSQRLWGAIERHMETVQGISIGGDVPRKLSNGQQVSRPTESTHGAGAVVRLVAIRHE